MPCMSYYNGWSPEQRRATVPIQLEAFRAGKIERPSQCSICGDKPKRPSDVLLHLERYDTPLVGFCCCRRCHNALHARFNDPRRWLRPVLSSTWIAEAWSASVALSPL